MTLTAFEKFLEQNGWTGGHAPDGLIAEKIKYKYGDEDDWAAFHKAIPQEPVEVIQYPCILVFEHEAHTFPLELTVHGTYVKQRCPGVRPMVSGRIDL